MQSNKEESVLKINRNGDMTAEFIAFFREEFARICEELKKSGYNLDSIPITLRED